MNYAVVIPTVGRPSLAEAVSGIACWSTQCHSRLPEIVVVDDRPVPGKPLPMNSSVRVLCTGGRGPAAARNAGWRAVGSEWVVFLDDDVVPGPDWALRIAEDLRDLPSDVGASQGRIEVPLPADRRPTDVERGTAGLATAQWITADMAYRRIALQRVGGFDERFGRAYREDADLALRVLGAGYHIVAGRRCTTHPVPVEQARASWLASVRAQRGNADDALMRRRHGPGWRHRIGDGPGRLRRHVLSTAAAALALGAAAGRRRRLAGTAALIWAALTAEFAVHRILPGPRDAAEIGRMVASSLVIPPVACWHRLAGKLRWWQVTPAGPLPAAVLFDRDGTLIHDVAYNADPDAVRPIAGVKQALDRLRKLGIPIGVVSNQSGVARGLISPAQLDRVNARVVQLLGPFDVLCFCVHGEHDGCGCRKPAPGLVHTAAAELGVPVQRCVVIGDIGADVTAATAAGALGILVPNARTRRAEVLAARLARGAVAPDVPTAVELALSGRVG